MIQNVVLLIGDSLIPQILRAVWLLMPIWLPLALLAIFWHLWGIYVRARFIAKMEFTVLEIKLPKEQLKSPLAMELVINILHERAGDASFYERYFRGSVRPWFSLELVSEAGDIRFYVWTQTKFAPLIESQIYAQYPGVEVFEVPDYTKEVKYDPEKTGVWGTEFKLTKPDAYPIKTYIDYGMDKDPKEEFKIDPMTPVLEFLGSLQAGEKAWYQIMIQYHRDRQKYTGGIINYLFGKKTNWNKDAEEIVNTILKRDPKTKTPKTDVKTASGFPVLPQITEGEKRIVDAIERSLTKNSFDVGIRALLIHEAGKFNKINIAGLIGSWRQYGSNDLNGFKPIRGLMGFEMPWNDFREVRQKLRRKRMYNAYLRRSYFYRPYKEPPYVLNTEELATIFHFPGSVATTPTFQRIEAKKTEPPSNLPI